MQRRAPTYSVTTIALVLIAVAAFGVRYAARYLPERQPNELQGEHGEYVRRSMRETVRWHPYGAEAFRQAAERGKIVFLDIGTVMSLSAKRFSEDYATDGEYRMLLHDHFEPVKIDALEMPWIVEALGIQTPSFQATERWLAVTTDPRGGIVSVTGMRPRDGNQSMAEWLEELARLRYASPGEVVRRADLSRQERAEKATAVLMRGPCNEDVALAWASVWQQAAVAGVFGENETFVTVLPMEVLAALPNDVARMASLNLLLELAISPSFDAVDGGFFIAALAPHWRQPIASKVTGHSLQLAAAFAEAGSKFDAPLFKGIAERTVAWARHRRSGGLFEAGLGTDQGLDNYSAYYRLSEGEVEAMPFWVGETGFPRIQTLGGFESNVNQRRSETIFAAAERLLGLRKTRQLPRSDRGRYADQNGQAASGLFRIATALDDQTALDLAIKTYKAAKAEFVQPLGDVLHSSIGRGRSTSYSGSYVWMARAAIDGYLATGDAEYLADADRIMSRALELFQGESGALMSYLPSLLSDMGFDLEVYRIDDTELPSTNALAALNLADLAALRSSTSHRVSAENIIRAFSGRFADTGAPAGITLAALRLYVEPVSLRARP
jgi:uncharacterized protein YyaL (SSP411 family)